jgi:hypothetical protein
MKLRITVALATLALAAPLAAYASVVVTRAGDQTTSIGGKGCRVVKNADHSLTVHCSGTHWATLHWAVWGDYGPTTLTVTSARPLKYPATFTCGSGWKHPVVICNVTQLVHNNTVTSVTATFP